MEIGTKYEETKTLDITEIAKMVRKDIKAACGEALQPGFKFGVTVKRYSGGRSITVSLKAAPADFKAFDAVGNYSDAGMYVRSVLQGILDQYNFDKSDIMTDYFYVRFYSHIYLHQ